MYVKYIFNTTAEMVSSVQWRASRTLAKLLKFKGCSTRDGIKGADCITFVKTSVHTNNNLITITHVLIYYDKVRRAKLFLS